MVGTSVKVSQGTVCGCEETLPNGEKYFRFSGIPFATPPINELKFKPPQKLLKFKTPEIDCTKEGSECFQKSKITGQFVGSEDCLYLNVYVPESAKSTKLPVMVFIHGGGFIWGSSTGLMYSPEYLLMENVIVVTVNYRLSTLGFLCLPSMGIPGNAGLKDQQMSLEWVYENISNFNGDPENICLFGESAGAASVNLHILNRKSRKFIKSAICQSGSALGDWVLQKNPVERTRKLAELLGCQNMYDDNEIYNTLMAAPLADLVKYSFKAGSKDDKRRGFNFVFTPCIEDKTSVDPFLSKSPTDLMKEECINIPVMHGTNDKDGMIQAGVNLNELEIFNRDPVRMVPMSVNIDPNSAMAEELGRKVKEFYFGTKNVGKETIDSYFDLMTDIHFLIPQTIMNELHARYQQESKQFLYEFRFDGELNLMKNMIELSKYKGACHADELFYLFRQTFMEFEISEDSPASKMRSIMCKIWTNFAKYQNPTPEFNNPLNVIWNPTEHAYSEKKTVSLDYLVINNVSKMEKNVNGERMDFWRNVYKTWNASFIKSKF